MASAADFKAAFAKMALCTVRPKWSAEQLPNFVKLDLTHIYETVAEGCQTVCHQTLKPYDFVLDIQCMPMILDMTIVDIRSAAERVATLAAKHEMKSVSQRQYMQAFSAAIRHSQTVILESKTARVQILQKDIDTLKVHKQDLQQQVTAMTDELKRLTSRRLVKAKRRPIGVCVFTSGEDNFKNGQVSPDVECLYLS